MLQRDAVRTDRREDHAEGRECEAERAEEQHDRERLAVHQVENAQELRDDHADGDEDEPVHDGEHERLPERRDDGLDRLARGATSEQRLREERRRGERASVQQVEHEEPGREHRRAQQPGDRAVHAEYRGIEIASFRRDGSQGGSGHLSAPPIP